MSEVNRAVYPARPVTLTGLEITQPSLNDTTYYPNDADWDESICISQSMSPNAPYNNLGFYLPIDNNGDSQYEYLSKPIQKIGLYYTQALNTFGRENQSPTDPSGQIYDYAAWRLSYGRKPYVGGQYVNNLKPQNYYFVTGLDLQAALCVVCVRFVSDNYCSLKYYLDHKSDTLASETPSSLFMVGLFGGENTVSRQSFAPFDTTPYEFVQWARDEQNVVTKNRSPGGACSTKYPIALFGTTAAFTQVAAPGNRNVGTLDPRCLIFPLVGCMFGEGVHFTPSSMADWWTANPRQNYSSLIIIGGREGEHYTIENRGVIPNVRIRTILTQEALDKVLSIAATYGIPFSTDFPSGYNDFYSAANGLTTYMPIANEGGYYDGKFELLTQSGVLNPELSPASSEQWEGGITAPYDDRYYDPSIPVPVDQIDLTQPTVSPIGSFNKTYILNKQEVDAIQAYIYGADDTTLENFLKGISNFGANPMDAFISLHMWPFDVRDFVTASATAQVTVGRTAISDSVYGDVIGYLMPTNSKAVVDCGSFKISPKFSSFLDYEPYTTINLFIPFVGTVDLAPSLYMGKTINVRLICDWITGAATAVVYADGIPLVYQQGVGAVSISMTGDNHAKSAGDVIGGVIGAAGSAVGAVAAAKTGQLGSAAQLAGKAVEMGSQAFMDYGKTDFTQAGSSSPMCSLYMPMYCYLTISTPKLLIDGEDLDQWAHGVGYADSRITTLAAEGSSGDGIVIGSPVRISFTGSVQPTPGEIDRILQALGDGVFPA